MHKENNYFNSELSDGIFIENNVYDKGNELKLEEMESEFEAVILSFDEKCSCSLHRYRPTKVAFGLYEDHIFDHIDLIPKNVQTKLTNITEENNDKKLNILEDHALNSKLVLGPEVVHKTKSVTDENNSNPENASINLCNECDKTFLKKSDLRDHIKFGHAQTTIKCKFCKISFTARHSLARHQKYSCKISKSKNPKIPHECNECDKIFEDKQYLLRHIKTAHTVGIVCKYCKKTFSKRSNLYRHQTYACKLKESETGNSKIRQNKIYYICDYCKKEFTHKKSFIYHVEKHMGIKHHKKFTCKICNKAYLMKISLTSHIQSHHLNAKLYCCNYCDEKFSWRGGLYSHEKKYHSENNKKYFEANDKKNRKIDDIFYNENNNIYELLNGNIKVKKDVEIEIESDGTETIFQLDQETAKATGELYDEHVNKDKLVVATEGLQLKSAITERETKGKHVIKQNEVKLLQCKKCEASFMKKLDLLNHEKLSLACSFTDKENLIQHQKNRCNMDDIKNVKIPIRTKYVCNECEKVYFVRQCLVRHLKMMHSTFTGAVACKYCNKKFSIVPYLKRHQNYFCKMNKNKKQNNAMMKYGMYFNPFICDYCKKEFTHKKSLIDHIKKHIGTFKKFPCQYCSKEYTKKHNLTCHVQSQHLKVKGYSCKYCDKKFTWHWLLKRHEKKYHSDE